VVGLLRDPASLSNARSFESLHDERSIMPATILSHQALVLPLKMRWPRAFSGLALCIGSMAPDLEFIGRMTNDWLFSHTVSAQLWFSMPLTVGLTWLLTACVLPRLLPYVRDHLEWRLHDLAAIEVPHSSLAWARVAWSGWVGGLSHVLLDGITHGNHSGWLVPHFPLLRTPVPHFGGPVPLHDALQFWLTLLLAVVSVVLIRSIARRRLLWQWRERLASSLPRQPRAAGWQLLRLAGGAALVGAAAGCTLERHSTAGTLAAVFFGAIDFAGLALVLVAWRLGYVAKQHALTTPPAAGAPRPGPIRAVVPAP
jgi:hypothetical protein